MSEPDGPPKRLPFRHLPHHWWTRFHSNSKRRFAQFGSAIDDVQCLFLSSIGRNGPLTEVIFPTEVTLCTEEMTCKIRLRCLNDDPRLIFSILRRALASGNVKQSTFRYQLPAQSMMRSDSAGRGFAVLLAGGPREGTSLIAPTSSFVRLLRIFEVTYQP